MAVALFGDGALDEGIAYEALNIASLYSLPVLFLCENNSKEGEAQTSRLATKELIAVPARARDSVRPHRRRRRRSRICSGRACARACARWQGPVFPGGATRALAGARTRSCTSSPPAKRTSCSSDQAKASNEHAEWQRTDPVLRYARTLIAAARSPRTTCWRLTARRARR